MFTSTRAQVFVSWASALKIRRYSGLPLNPDGRLKRPFRDPRPWVCRLIDSASEPHEAPAFSADGSDGTFSRNSQSEACVSVV